MVEVGKEMSLEQIGDIKYKSRDENSRSSFWSLFVGVYFGPCVCPHGPCGEVAVSLANFH